MCVPPQQVGWEIYHRRRQEEGRRTDGGERQGRPVNGPDVEGPSLSLIRLVFRYLQLNHHLPNWTRLPNGLNDRILNLVDDTNPPMKSVDLINSLEIASTTFAEKLALIVWDHINKQLTLTEEALQTTDTRHIDTAIKRALNMLKTRLGNKYNNFRALKSISKLTHIINVHSQSHIDINCAPSVTPLSTRPLPPLLSALLSLPLLTV